LSRQESSKKNFVRTRKSLFLTYFGECSVRQGLHLGRRTQIVLQIFQYLDQSDVALQEGVVDMLCKDKMKEQLNTGKVSYLRKNSKKLSSRNGSKPRTRDTE
jgi:hypothetical protein